MDITKKIIIPLLKQDNDIKMFGKNGWEDQDKITADDPCFKNGDIIVFFANLNIDDIAYKKIEQCFHKPEREVFADEYMINATTQLENLVGEGYSEIIAMDTVNKYLKQKGKMTVFSLEKSFKKSLKQLCSSAYSQALLANRVSEDESSRFMYGILFDVFGNLGENVTYAVQSGLRNNELELVEIFCAKTGWAVLELDQIAIFKNKINIKECENCKKYFIPTSRSDEKYCNNVYRNGKTCKEIGYITKVNSDDILKTYRSIYKTQNARKQRNKNNVTNIDERFKKWHEYAKGQLELCKNEEISIDEMISRINTSDWVKGGSPDGDNS